LLALWPISLRLPFPQEYASLIPSSLPKARISFPAQNIRLWSAPACPAFSTYRVSPKYRFPLHAIRLSAWTRKQARCFEGRTHLRSAVKSPRFHKHISLYILWKKGEHRSANLLYRRSPLCSPSADENLTQPSSDLYLSIYCSISFCARISLPAKGNTIYSPKNLEVIRSAYLSLSSAPERLVLTITGIPFTSLVFTTS